MFQAAASVHIGGGQGGGKTSQISRATHKLAQFVDSPYVNPRHSHDKCKDNIGRVRP